MIQLRTIGALVLTSSAFITPAFAQATAPPAAPGLRSLSIGAVGGLQAVQHVGGVVGGRLGFRVSPKLEITGEAAWLQDTVTRRRVETATLVAEYLQLAQGSVATSSIDAPALWFGGGVQYALANVGKMQVLATGQAGLARVAIRPAFTVGGSDVTTHLPDFGVSLGADLTGTATVPGFGGGISLRIPRGIWNIDAGIRVLSLRTNGQPSNVLGALVCVGRVF